MARFTMIIYIFITLIFALVFFTPLETTLLLLLVLIPSQPNIRRFFAASVFTALVIAHYLADEKGFLGDAQYYLYACLANMVVIVGTRKAVAMAVKNNKITARWSALKERLRA